MLLSITVTLTWKHAEPLTCGIFFEHFTIKQAWNLGQLWNNECDVEGVKKSEI